MARLPMGELEATVMEILWDRGGWSTPGEVHDVLAEDRPIAYTTVMTILVRLWRKGRVDRQRDGRAFAYQPVRSRDEHAAARMHDYLVAAGDRPAALSYFVASLSTPERVQLRRIVASQRAKDRP
ncbi:MAG: BlaI/MecI/CopY family transcriptional regulator [Acidimicrobiales bacterium]